MTSETMNVEGSGMDNQSYLSDSFTMMRIDARELIAELEAFYRGMRVVGWKETDNSIKPVFEQLGRPRMNDKGIQDMMSWLKSLFNPQTVQGNTSELELSQQLANINADLAENLMINLHEYDISENDYNGIIDRTMTTATFFFSRTLDNLERESYGQTTRSVERMSSEKAGWNPFGGKQ